MPDPNHFDRDPGLYERAEAARAGAAVDELGGEVEEHYRTPLVVLTRR